LHFISFQNPKIARNKQHQEAAPVKAEFISILQVKIGNSTRRFLLFLNLYYAVRTYRRTKRTPYALVHIRDACGMKAFEIKLISFHDNYFLWTYSGA